MAGLDTQVKSEGCAMAVCTCFPHHDFLRILYLSVFSLLGVLYLGLLRKGNSPCLSHISKKTAS